MVEVASVVVPLVIRASLRVEEAVERKPFKKARVVEVAFSLVESLVKGKAKPGEEEREPLVRVRLEPTVRALKEPSAPMYGILERREEAVTARLVVVAWEVVALEAVKFCKVEEPLTRRLVMEEKTLVK